MEFQSHSDMIDLFIDGELASEYRAELFTALSTNEELQAELQQAIVIRLAALREASNLTPPPTLTQSILSSVSTTIPRTPGFLTRIWHRAAVRYLALTIAAISSGFLLGRYTVPENGMTHPMQYTLKTAVSHEPIIALSSVGENPPSPSHSAQHTFLRHNPSYVSSQLLTTNINSPQSFGSEIIPMELSVISPEPDSPALASAQQNVTSTTSNAPHTPHNSQLPISHSNISSFPEPSLDPTIEHIRSSWVIALRRTYTLSIRQLNLIQPIGNHLLNNIIATIEYRQPTVGYYLEVGNEQFPLYALNPPQQVGVNNHSNNSTPGNTTPSYTLHQMLEWVAVGMRGYIPLPGYKEIGTDLSCIVGIGIGSSRYGILGRGQLGFLWELLPQLGIQALLEGMVHSHGIGSNWEHAEKLSTSIGLLYRF